VGGLQVEKVGRTTQHTKGIVTGQWFGPHPINYSADQHSFRGVVLFQPVFVIIGVGNLFADNGDSGALITAKDPAGIQTAVGIVVGGMNDGNAPGNRVTIALPIQPILNEFNVSLLAGHNV
jgi:hypothetical protein